MEGKKTITFAIVGILGWLGWSDFITLSEIGEGVSAFSVIISLAGTIWGRVVATKKIGGGNLE